MNKSAFITSIRNDIYSLLSDTKLINNKNQLFAWKLNSEFRRTFDENYLLNQALFLSTNSCLILQNDISDKLAFGALYESAEIFQYLNESERTNTPLDKDFLKILAALCYDISGYQANAYCLARQIDSYQFSTSDSRIDISIDNIIIEQIRNILTKSIQLARSDLYNNSNLPDVGFKLFYNAMEKWYVFLLKQEDSDYLIALDKAYYHYLHSGNIYLSQLLLLLKIRLSLFDTRSIYRLLNQYEEIKSNYQWKKYIKLLAYDYYDNHNIKQIGNRKSVFEFWPSQLRALEQGILTKNENFVVQMPTSSGKTFIAELLILKYLVKYPDKKCIYIAPFRALTNEKEYELGRYFSKMGYSVSSLSGSYEIDCFQDVILNETNLLIATPEKIDCLLRFVPDYFNDISLIVIDEGHIISELSSRATLLEFLVIRLRIKIPGLRILFISAVMPPNNANEYSQWLNGDKNNVLRSLRFSDSDINDEWEPTRKLISGHYKNGNIIFKNVTYENEDTHTKQGAILNSFLQPEFNITNMVKKDIAASLALKLSDDGITLVFCAQPRWAKSIAESLLKIIKRDNCPSRFTESSTKASSYYAKIWFGSNSIITQSVDHGIGIHYGDMPEQVRNAIENDFRDGKLSILLATNTVGQGLNFPIKNIIIYSLNITYNNNKPVYIQKRDFWNLVGRAGRAGKETEGKIIFIINSKNDNYLYDMFIDRNNIENAESLFYKALKLRINERIVTAEDFIELISELSETYLMDLLTEEIIGTDYEEIINKIINTSLFKTQIDNSQLDITPIKTAFKKIFTAIENSASIAEINEYKKTGLSFRNNKAITDYIIAHEHEIKQTIENNNLENIVRLFIHMLSEINISELTNDKLKKIFEEHSILDYEQIILNWINGQNLNELVEYWNQSLGSDIEKFHILLSQGLYYLYPWGMSSFLILIAFRLGIELKNLPENVRSASSCLKYGQNSNTACLAVSLGIKSRTVANLLYHKSGKLQGKEFIRWVSNITSDEIKELQLDYYDFINLNEIVSRIHPSSEDFFGQSFTFELKGTQYNYDWCVSSKEVTTTDILSYRRDEFNEYDPFAIIILHKDSPIGFVPRNYARILSTEIDIEEKSYLVTVEKIETLDDYNAITVLMVEEKQFFVEY